MEELLVCLSKKLSVSLMPVTGGVVLVMLTDHAAGKVTSRTISATDRHLSDRIGIAIRECSRELGR